MNVTTGTKSGTTFVVTMPNSISNGGGDNNSLTDQNPPVVGVWKLSDGAYNASGTISINTRSNFNVYTVGAINQGINNIIRFLF